MNRYADPSEMCRTRHEMLIGTHRSSMSALAIDRIVRDLCVLSTHTTYTLSRLGLSQSHSIARVSNGYSEGFSQTDKNGSR